MEDGDFVDRPEMAARQAGVDWTGLKGSGRLPVDRTLRVAELPGVWAIGDCAAVPDSSRPGSRA